MHALFAALRSSSPSVRKRPRSVLFQARPHRGYLLPKPAPDRLIPLLARCELCWQRMLPAFSPHLFAGGREQLNLARRIVTVRVQVKYRRSQPACLVSGSLQPSPSDLPSSQELQPLRFRWIYPTECGWSWGRHCGYRSQLQSWRLKLKQLPLCRVPQTRSASRYSKTFRVGGALGYWKELLFRCRRRYVRLPI